MTSRAFLLFAFLLTVLSVSCTRQSERAWEEYNQAESLYADNNHEAAFWHYLMAEDLGDKCGDDIVSGYACVGLARMLRNTCNYDEVIHYAGKAKEALRNRGEDRQLAVAHWLLQSAYCSLDEYELSKAEADTARIIARHDRDTLTLVLSLETSIKSCFRSGPYETPHLWAYKDSLDQLGWSVSIPTLVSISILYTWMDEWGEARQLVDSAYRYAVSPEQHLDVLYADYVLSLSTAPERSHNLLRQLWNEQQSLYHQWLAHSGVQTIVDFQEWRKQEELRKNYSKQVLTVGILLFLLILLAVSQTTLRKHRQLALSEAKRLSDALDAQVSAMEELKGAINTQEEVALQLGFGTLDTLCEEYYTGGHVKEQRVAKAFDELIRKYRNDISFWNAFQNRVDHLHGGVISLMKEELDGFKPADFYLMTYIVSGMSYFSISVLMGVDKPNLYNRAKRIRDRIRNGNCAHKELFLAALSRASAN